MKNKHGFTMVEILISATVLALVSSPFLLAISNLGYRYRNLRHTYYAQLIAQRNMELITNLLQGRNPNPLIPNEAVKDTSNYFCDNKKFSITPPPLKSLCTTNTNPKLPLMSYFQSPVYISQPTRTDPITTVSPSEIKWTDEVENIEFYTKITMSPICRKSSNPNIHNIQPPGNVTQCDLANQYQDLNSIEITVTTSWDPPGPLTEEFTNYKISSIFTEFIETTPTP